MIFTKLYIRIFKILLNKVSINRETIYLEQIMEVDH